MSFDFNIPLPPKAPRDRLGLKDFPTGASKFFAAHEISRNRLYTALNHHNPDADFSVRKLTEGGVVGYRAWRTR